MATCSALSRNSRLGYDLDKTLLPHTENSQIAENKNNSERFIMRALRRLEISSVNY
jgi:hypothetical protein